jgi:hypothetical protein
MTDNSYMGFQTLGTTTPLGKKPADEADPDRLPEIKPNAKTFSLREVVEIEKQKAKQRREARMTAGPKP